MKQARPKVRIRKSRGGFAPWLGLALAGAGVFLLIVVMGTGTYYWFSFGRMIDERLSGHVQQTTARISAEAMRISAGEKMTVAALSDHLQRAGYSELDVSGTPGRYVLHGNEIEIRPSQESYVGVKNRIVVDFTGGAIQKIRS